MPHLPSSRKTPSSADRRTHAAGRAACAVAALVGLVVLVLTPRGFAQAPPGSDLRPHLANLASIDYPTRMNAARMIRRAPAADAVAILRQAIEKDQDEFVRYRAFILLTSFNDRATSNLVRTVLSDRNDRLREAAYKWLELNPDPSLTATLLAALRTEQAEFVRPALIGALAAVDENPQVQKALVAESTRGVDFFRSAVIDALGRHRATYAVDAIAGVAQQEGPLQDDAVLALGRIGGARAREALAAIQTRSSDVALSIHAARCLAGDTCDAHLQALSAAAAAPGASTQTLRVAVAGLSAIAADGNDAATAALLMLAGRGGNARDQAALGLAAAAVRNPGHVIAWLDAAPTATRAEAIPLLRVGFEDLEEDFGEEQFFAAARAAYWTAAEDSSSRTLAATLIQELEF